MSGSTSEPMCVESEAEVPRCERCGEKKKAYRWRRKGEEEYRVGWSCQQEICVAGRRRAKLERREARIEILAGRPTCALCGRGKSKTGKLKNGKQKWSCLNKSCKEERRVNGRGPEPLDFSGGESERLVLMRYVEKRRERSGEDYRLSHYRKWLKDDLRGFMVQLGRLEEEESERRRGMGADVESRDEGLRAAMSELDRVERAWLAALGKEAV